MAFIGEQTNKTTVNNFHNCKTYSMQAVEHLAPRPIEACQYNETLIKVTRKDGRCIKTRIIILGKWQLWGSFLRLVSVI